MSHLLTRMLGRLIEPKPHADGAIHRTHAEMRHEHERRRNEELRRLRTQPRYYW